MSWKTPHGGREAARAPLAEFLAGPGARSVRQTHRQQCTYRACSSADEHGARPGRGAAHHQQQREMFREPRISIAQGRKCLPAPSRTGTSTTRGAQRASSDFSELARMRAARHASPFPSNPHPPPGIRADLYGSTTVPIGHQLAALATLVHLSIRIIDLLECQYGAQRKVVLHW